MLETLFAPWSLNASLLAGWAVGMLMATFSTASGTRALREEVAELRRELRERR